MNCKEKVKQDSVSELIIRFTTNLANRIIKLDEDVNIKLMPIMTQSIPTEEQCIKEHQREYPPLFTELKTQL